MENKRINVVDQLHCKGRIALGGVLIFREKDREAHTQRQRERKRKRDKEERDLVLSLLLGKRRCDHGGVHQKNQTHTEEQTKPTVHTGKSRKLGVILLNG